MGCIFCLHGAIYVFIEWKEIVADIRWGIDGVVSMHMLLVSWFGHLYAMTVMMIVTTTTTMRDGGGFIT